MTTVTKIFVILVCLFAFIFTPMAISFAARTYDWKAIAEQRLSTAQTAEARARSEASLRDAQKTQYDGLLAKASERVLFGEQRIAELQRQIDALTQQRDQLARSEESWRTSAGLLTAELAVRSKHNQELEGSREKCLARERELQATNVWLKDQLQARSTELEVVTQQLRQRQQEIVAYRDENERLRKAQGLGRAGEIMTAGPSPSVEATTPATSSPIQGRVTEVRGKDASIDVGNASGLKEGMTMVVLRNNNYIGDLKITSTTPNEAVGEVRSAGDRQVKAGDAVLDEVTFNSR